MHKFNTKFERKFLFKKIRRIRKNFHTSNFRVVSDPKGKFVISCIYVSTTYIIRFIYLYSKSSQFAIFGTRTFPWIGNTQIASMSLATPNSQIHFNHSKEIQYIIPPRIWKVSHSTKIPLELLGPAIGCWAGSSSSKGNFRWMRNFSNSWRYNILYLFTVHDYKHS